MTGWPHGARQFHGRGMCREHDESLPHMEARFRCDGALHNVVVVSDAPSCGDFQPREDSG
jgi:hypothetical protein